MILTATIHHRFNQVADPRDAYTIQTFAQVKMTETRKSDVLVDTIHVILSALREGRAQITIWTDWEQWEGL